MGQFLEELKRRKVVRVAIAYLVSAWVILQMADVISPILELQGWVNKLIFFLLLAGFIPALILSWLYQLTAKGLKRDSREPLVSDARGLGQYLEHALVAVLGLALLSVIGYWYMGRDARWAKNEAYPRIEKHADAGEWEQAYALARQVEAVLPDDPVLGELWKSFSWVTTIPSNPPGAMVYRRSYSNASTEWQKMGTTPLHDIHIPFGLSLLRIELGDRPPLLRAVGSGLLVSPILPVQEKPDNTKYLVNPEPFEIDTRESLPDGMVRVPGEEWVLDGEQIELRDFFVNRYEVTNREFKEFVDANGYQRRDLWEHVFILDGETITWEQAMARFTDTTGRPGPGTWEAGSYPDGKEDHPVAGVNWYEAAAYALFVGRELPTLHHWRRALAEATLPWLIPTSNLERDGSAPVGKFQGIGWTGTYDMAGNVREWCFNSIGDQRVIIGGAWNDAAYVVDVTGGMPPLDRSAINGFRLMVSRDEGPVARRLQEPVSIPEAPRHADPVSDEVFTAYLSDFEYDQGPLNANIEETRTARYWTRERITFDTSDGDERIILYLYLPNTDSSRYQTVIYWPGGIAMVLDSVDQVLVQFDFLLKSGRAVAFPVLKGTYDRRFPKLPTWSTVSGRDLAIQQTREMRRSIDYLETRPDIDPNALAYYGLSWGGRIGAIALAVEPRLKVGVLNQAGLNFDVHRDIDVVHYLPRVTVPVLQFNGRYDTDFRYETSAKPYFDLLGTAQADKSHVIEDTGHFVPRPVMIGETLSWLDKYLGRPD